MHFVLSIYIVQEIEKFNYELNVCIIIIVNLNVIMTVCILCSL